MNKTNLVMAFFVAAVLAGVLVQFNFMKSPRGAVKEDFMQKPLGAPTSGSSMGPYDGTSLAAGFSGWAGNEAPISSDAPAGQANDNKLMFLVGNKTDPSCCPAAFNTDTGCVCLTEENRALMASRAGNKV